MSISSWHSAAGLALLLCPCPGRAPAGVMAREVPEPRGRPNLYRASAMILALACILAPATAQDVITSESTQKKPGPEVTCDPEEMYRHENHCCFYCPPGTLVTQPCTSQGTLGVCDECPLGEYSPPNSRDHCTPCTRCKEDQEMRAPCYKETDAQCRCKAGHYCEGPDCATCRPCRPRCPEGEELLQGCTDTADIVCEAPTTGGTGKSYLCFLLLLLPLILIILRVRKWKFSGTKSSQAVPVNGQVNSPRSSAASEGVAGRPLLTEVLETEINGRHGEEEGGQMTTASQSGRSENSNGLPVSLSQPLTGGNPFWVGSPAATGR
ncbi:uncharacterized protein LOC141546319 [Sminthopsis crassicaudata]|uniref:uncharacterized protein LOC141546319 n=1 Tax=Sminthopsis crassicaudata TaxID=9301 RepID=UPI003D69A588